MGTYLSLYMNYYRAQAGNDLPGFRGVPVMYGVNIGGIFHSLFRKTILLLKRFWKLLSHTLRVLLSSPGPTQVNYIVDH